MNIIGKRNIFFGISLAYILFGIVIAVMWGFNFGVDFKGGTIIEIKPNNENISTEDIRNSLQGIDFVGNTTIQKSQDTYLIRIAFLNQEQNQKIKSILNEKIGEYEEIRFESVGPIITKNITKNAIISIVIASIVIVMYIAFAFRKIPKPASSWRFGITAIITLAHDLLILIFSFAIMGHFMGYQIDVLSITAVLTVLGYSVNDTIVIFDRIRENLHRSPSKSFEQITNDSLNQTLARSINTTITTAIPLIAILVIGGGTLKPFILALLIGIIAGAYSSIFIASPIIVIWQNKILKKQKINVG